MFLSKVLLFLTHKTQGEGGFIRREEEEKKKKKGEGNRRRR
jgi:hypothetical protein